MEIKNCTDILETTILIGEEDAMNMIDTSLLMYLLPYRCGYDNKEDVMADGKTPVVKKIKVYICVEDA